MIRFVLYLALLAFAIAFAAIRGGRAEKQVAAIVLAINAADLLYHSMLPGGLHWNNVDLGHAALDSAGLAAFMAVALTADRIWPIWVCSAQLLSVSVHTLKLMHRDIWPLVYQIQQTAPFYVILLLLVYGTYRQRQPRVPAATN